MEYSEEKFLNQQAYVNRLYKQQEKNTNLTLDQHRLIQEISTIRHKLHSVGWKVYAGRPVTKEIRNFFRKSPKDFLELGLPYPRAAFDTYRTMETVNDLLKFSNPSEIEVKNSCTMFIQEKEFINEIFQGYLENIDSEYGTSYAPKGHRKTMELKDYAELDVSYILEAYRRGEFEKALEYLATTPKTIKNISIEERDGGIRYATGIYERTPFSLYISSSGKAYNIQMHTPKQDLAPTSSVAVEIANACLESLYKAMKHPVKKENTIIAFSMDDVLSRFTKGLSDVNGQIHLSNIYKALEKPGFFKSLETEKNIVTGLKAFIKAHPEVDVYIMSTAKPTDPPAVHIQKEHWLNRNLSEIPPSRRMFINPDVSSKSDFIKKHPDKNCILFDSDFNNVREFEAMGGTAVKVGQTQDLFQHERNLYRDGSPASVYQALEIYTGVDHIQFKFHKNEVERNINIGRKENDLEFNH